MLVDYAVGRIEVMNPVSIHRVSLDCVSRFSLIRRESGGEFSGARIVNSRGRNRPIRRLHVAVTTSLITSAESFEVGRLIGSYGFMNVTSYSGLRSGDEFESTSDDIGRVESQDIGEGGVKISLSANYTKEEYHRVGFVEHLSHFVITFLHGAMKGLAIMHANDRLHQSLGPSLIVLKGSPLTWIIPLGPVRQRSTSTGRTVPGLGTKLNTQYRIW